MNSVHSINEAPPSIALDEASNLVKALSAPDVVKVYHRPTTSSKPLSRNQRHSRSANGSMSAEQPLLWECELADDEANQGTSSQIALNPAGSVKQSRGSAGSQFVWESCGYPDFTIKHKRITQ